MDAEVRESNNKEQARVSIHHLQNQTPLYSGQTTQIKARAITPVAAQQMPISNANALVGPLADRFWVVVFCWVCIEQTPRPYNII